MLSGSRSPKRAMGALPVIRKLLTVATTGALLLTLISTGSASAAASTDLTFGGGLAVVTAGAGTDTLKAVALQGDGKVVVVGSASNGTNLDFAIARVNADGTSDTSFGTGGSQLTSFGGYDDQANALAIQGDGDIVVAGAAGGAGGTTFALARYAPDGSLDASFGTSGKATTTIGTSSAAVGVAIQGDGRLVVAGTATISGNSQVSVARYQTDGSLDTSFGTNGIVSMPIAPVPDSVGGVAITSGGKIVISGASTSGMFTLQLNADGSLDSSFGSGGEVITSFDIGAPYVTLQPDGKIVLASGTNVARLNPDGSFDATFGSGGKVVGGAGGRSSLAIQPDGMILYDGLARLFPDGVADTSFSGASVPFRLEAVVAQSDDEVIAAGESYGGSFELRRFQANSSPWLELGAQGSASTRTIGQDLTYHLTVYGSGPGTATGVTVTDPLPTGVSLVSATSTQGAGCTGTTTVSCSLGSVPPGTWPTVDIIVQISHAYLLYNMPVVNSDQQSTSQQNSNPQVFTDVGPAPGSISSVNGLIAYASNAANNYDIYTMYPDGSHLTQLTASPGNDVWPSWSPDGTKIAFASDRTGHWQIFVMNADGSGQTNISNDAYTDESPAWSPNGSKIAFTSNNTSTGFKQIFVMNADGSGATQVSTNPGFLSSSPAWSPDGSKIAYWFLYSGSHLVVMNADGTGATYCLYATGSAGNVSWSPDGDRLAFPGTMVNADCTGQTALSIGADPRWAPDDAKLVTDRTPAGGAATDIYVVNRDGSGGVDLTNTPFINEIDPAWQNGNTTVADLSISGGATPSAPPFGGQVSYHLIAANAGPLDATGVSLTDALPSGFTLDSSTPSQGSCTGSATLTCTLGTIPSGSQVTIDIVANAGAVGSATNHATIAGGGEVDPTPSDNSADQTVTVSSPTLSVTKAGGGSGSVTSSPIGISCGPDCSSSFQPGTPVTLSASPAAGSYFAGWSGDCSGTPSTCDLTMDQDRSAQADFEPMPYLPDAAIRLKGGAWAGEGIENDTGAGQEVLAARRPGYAAVFVIRVFNAGLSIDSLRIQGAAGTRRAPVRYTSGGQDITSEVVSGAYSTPPLDPAGFARLRLYVRLSDVARHGHTYTFLVQATSSAQPSVLDAVIASVKVT